MASIASETFANELLGAADGGVEEVQHLAGLVHAVASLRPVEPVQPVYGFEGFVG